MSIRTYVHTSICLSPPLGSSTLQIRGLPGPLKPCQLLSDPARLCQALLSLLRPCQTLLVPTRLSQDLPGPLRPCQAIRPSQALSGHQAISGPLRPRQAISGLARPCQPFSGPARPSQAIARHSQALSSIHFPHKSQLPFLLPSKWLDK